MSKEQINQLKQWAQQQLPSSTIDLQAMPAQLSFRSFYRVGGTDRSLILMHSPPPKIL
ncbi:MAG: hypothetical protein HKM24_07080, partial [Gammaproteobacteria bacterium]|nr:hypothetical protein [Gammaproteobacteria bacterium]